MPKAMEKGNMKVSVIVTTYNKASELGRVLLGLSVQDALPHEVIVADDGSGPETAELIKGLIDDYPCRLLHVRHEDEGMRLANIRNRALNAATGDYVVVMDGDCLPGKHFISDHLSLADEGFFVQGKRIIVSREASVNLSQKEINSWMGLLWALLTGGLSNIHHLLRLPWLPALQKSGLHGIKGCNMAFHMKDVLAVNGYNEDFKGWGREDSEFAARLYNYGLKRKEHPFMAVCFHLWHEQQQRTMLDRNEELLKDTLGSGKSWCANGLDKPNINKREPSGYNRDHE